MSIFDNDANLPGVITEVETDYAFGYDTSQFGSTDSVVIIGTAFNGPVGQAMPVYSPEHASYVFGKTYDSARNIEASLVPGVQDAWNRGCRTIYACRVGGKDMYKDFEFNIDTDYRLRVSTMFPSNTGKDCYLLYDNTYGDETVTFYKPSERATIAEKRQGLVQSAASVLSTTIRLGADYGITSSDRLVEAIRTFNNHAFNNVLKLSIVDQDGVDVTESKEAYNLPLGIVFPGVYFIGRDHSTCEEKTKTQFHIVKDDVVEGDDAAQLPYTNFDQPYFRSLAVNTDVTQPLPIYDKDMNDLKAVLQKVRVTMDKPWDFLSVLDGADKAFVKDETDYEEADLAGYKLYERLGEGYAVTAHAIMRTKKTPVLDEYGKPVYNSDGTPKETVEELTPRIKETPMSNRNHTVPTGEGIYSVLQDAEIKYRVLNCANVDDKADGKLPKADAFRKTTAQQVGLLESDGDDASPRIMLTSKVTEDDRTDARAYDVSFQKIEKSLVDSVDDIYLNTVFKIIPEVPYDEKVFDAANVDNGTLVMAVKDDKGYLIRFNGKGWTKMNGEGLIGSGYIVSAEDGLHLAECAAENKEDAKTSDGKKTYTQYFFKHVASVAGKDAQGNDKQLLHNKEYILGESLQHVFVFQSGSTLSPLGDLKAMLTEEEEPVLVYAESHPFGKGKFIIMSSMFDTVTLEELVEYLNEDEVTKKIFTAEVYGDAAVNKADFVSTLMVEHKDAVPEVKDTDGVTVKTPAQPEVKGNMEAHMEADRNIIYDYTMYIPYRSIDSFARQLAQHCTYTELKTTPTWGFIGFSRVNNVTLSGVAQRVAAAVDANYDFYAKNNYGRNLLDRTNMPYPIGKNVSVIFTQYIVPMEQDSYSYIANGAAGYAGMVSALPLTRSSTNQPINIDTLSFTLTQSQLVSLTGKGIVTIKRSFTKGNVITDGITMAPADSVFRRLSASRVVGAVEDLIRQACEPYIGLQNHQANRNALNTAIEAQLESIKGTLIEDYKFTMNNNRALRKLSYIEINYQIVPVYEIREVRNTIKVKDSIES